MIRLKYERMMRGWSQTVLAAKAGLHASQISAYEHGGARPYPGQLKRLCQSLGIPLEEGELLFQEIPKREE